MTTKRLLLIVGGVVIAVGLLIAIFVGGIVGFALYTVGNSDAAMTAKEFLRHNERLQDDIGEVRDFGALISGSVNVHNSNGAATLSLKVIGERRTVNATVDLVYRDGRQWRVTAASYRNEAGQTVDLLNAYEAQQQIPLLVA